MIPVILGGLALLALKRRQDSRRPAASSINANNPTPEEDADWWSLYAVGNPEPGVSRFPGAVQPATSTSRLRNWLISRQAAWQAPPGGTNAVQQLSASPPGATVLPGPVPPGQPTPQSATASSSPWLPSDLQLGSPLAVSTWFSQLNLGDDPLSLWLGGAGSTIEIEKLSPSDLRPELA